MAKFSDLRFRKATQYNPYGRYADKYGIETYWVAEIPCGWNDWEYLCSEHTKTECMNTARKLIKNYK